MYDYDDHRERTKLLIAWNAYYLNRPGYWGCLKCGTHNQNHLVKCHVCGARCWKDYMPTELISLGPVTAIVQNRVYALPTARALLACDTVAATFVQSETSAFTVSAPVALTAAGQAEVAGGFLKCTSGNVNVSLKKF